MFDIDVAMVATNEEMERALVPVSYRDYCAHHFIRWQSCLRKEVWHWRCHQDEVQWEKCEYYEYLCIISFLSFTLVFLRYKRAFRKRDSERVAAMEQ